MASNQEAGGEVGVAAQAEGERMHPDGPGTMTLLDIVSSLDAFDEADTIYVKKPWSSGSAGVVAREPDKGGLPEAAAKLGMSYFLEISITREVLDGWMSNIRYRPTIQEKCDRVIKYAIDDA